MRTVSRTSGPTPSFTQIWLALLIFILQLSNFNNRRASKAGFFSCDVGKQQSFCVKWLHVFKNMQFLKFCAILQFLSERTTLCFPESMLEVKNYPSELSDNVRAGNKLFESRRLAPKAAVGQSLLFAVRLFSLVKVKRRSFVRNVTTTDNFVGVLQTTDRQNCKQLAKDLVSQRHQRTNNDNNMQQT